MTRRRLNAWFRFIRHRVMLWREVVLAREIVQELIEEEQGIEAW